MTWNIVPAIEADLPEILALQKRAFAREAARANDPTIPPMTQTLDELIAEARMKRVFKVVEAGQIIGSIRGHVDDTGTCHVARLCVHPAFQRRGLGTALMHVIEAAFAEAKRFELFTGAMATDNIQLYQRLGYHLIDRPAWAPPVLVFLEKIPTT